MRRAFHFPSLTVSKTLASIAMVSLVACTTTGVSIGRTDDRALRTLSWTAMQCVYVTARMNGARNISRQDAQNAVSSCEREISSYVSTLARRVQNDNGWSSLQSSVRPALRREYEARLVRLVAHAQ